LEEIPNPPKSYDKGGMLMSDYEILMIVLTVLGLLIAVWSGTKNNRH